MNIAHQASDGNPDLFGGRPYFRVDVAQLGEQEEQIPGDVSPLAGLDELWRRNETAFRTFSISTRRTGSISPSLTRDIVRFLLTAVHSRPSLPHKVGVERASCAGSFLSQISVFDLEREGAEGTDLVTTCPRGNRKGGTSRSNPSRESRGPFDIRLSIRGVVCLPYICAVHHSARAMAVHKELDSLHGTRVTCALSFAPEHFLARPKIGDHRFWSIGTWSTLSLTRMDHLHEPVLFPVQKYVGALEV
jgi:hypothetical protein